MKNVKLSSILEECRIMAFNANDTTVFDALLPYGYTPERLQAGVDLYNETALSFQIQKKEYTEQYYATNSFVAAFETFRKTFSNFCKIARIAFRTKIEGMSLIPVNTKIIAYSNWKVPASAFYNGVLSSEILLEEMAKFGVTPETLNNEINNLASLEVLSQKRFIEEGEAQTSTENRNRKFNQLRQYCSDLRTIAKIALADNPQQLEKLGITSRNVARKKAIPAQTVPEPKQ
jgi:hypothetical protein